MASAYRQVRSRPTGDEVRNSGASTSDRSTSTLQAESSDDDSEVGENAPDLTNSAPSSFELPLELKNRILMLTSRGVSYRHRHLLNDLHSLLPHSHRDTKLDTKSSKNYNEALNALAELHSCNYVFFLEARKRAQDLYLWVARTPNGPTVKFSVSNIHTMTELGFGGNCLKGGRGLVVFDKNFEAQKPNSEYRPLIREMLRGIFCVPSHGVRGMKPFVDHVIGVYSLDDKIWIRVYEIREYEKPSSHTVPAAREVTLVEIGPRFVLTPVLILESAFGGAKLFENKSYVSSNQIRSLSRIATAQRASKRELGVEDRKLRKQLLGLTQSSIEDSLANPQVFR